MTDFPTLDDPRTVSKAEFDRVVLRDLGHIEPHIDTTDGWCTMPLRLSHNAAAGVHLEIGPYDIDHRDIERLKRAIAAYDRAVHGDHLRRIK